MKKILFALCLILLSTTLSAQSSKEYKEVLMDGKFVSKWVKKTYYNKINYFTIEEVDELYGEDTTRYLKTNHPGIKNIEEHIDPPASDYSANPHILKGFDESGTLLFIYNNYSTLLEEYKYDKNKNMIYSRVNNMIRYYEYDSSNNLIHVMDDGEFEEWRTYNSKKQLVKVTNSFGGESTYEYDTKGRLIKVVDGGIVAKEYRYDSKDNVIYSFELADGVREYKYDAKNNVIYSKYKPSDYEMIEEWYEYTAAGKSWHQKNSDGGEIWMKWNSKGKILWEKSTYGSEEWYEYSADGNFCHKKDQKGKHTWYEELYDSKGRLVEYNIYETN